MPKRVTTHRFETPQFQGDGSYIVLKAVPYGIAKKAKRFIGRGDTNQRTDLTDEQKEKLLNEETALTEQLIFDSVMEWNWVDDTDQPLPLPRKTEDLDLLTADEVAYILETVTGMTGGEAKNSTSAPSTTSSSAEKKTPPQ